MDTLLAMVLRVLQMCHMTIYPYFLLLPLLPASKSPLAAAVRSLGPQWHPTRKIGAMVTEELLRL